ncbi:MAG: DNA gyrase subunit A [Planctomycetota bacterium]|nr:DNA gyrase subunit A [Planctomycetota bacterium]
MTNQPNIDPAPEGIDRILQQPIVRELHESYLVYAMSTIMDRALPDVRDGLKPSQRRILVAMNDLNLTPGRKHMKCAKICGDTSGNYHPHGESVIYPTLVNLGQSWKTRQLLIDKQGNFGSIEGDPAAAMRYTEARMTAAAVSLMEDLDKETVDFKRNYDDRLDEPIVLPARFPNLLVNGSSGIAVGMASSMPPHNVGEICEAIMATIDRPDIGIDELLTMVPGPDFPTGGTIIGRRGIVDAYSTGRGRIQVRGKVRHEKVGDRNAIVITEIPYQVDQSKIIEKIVDSTRKDDRGVARIPEIADVRNHSGRDAQTRILILLKKGADPDVVERQLYEYTPMQSTFSIINIALVHGQPRTLPFKDIVQCYIDHRREVVRRRTEFLLRRARQAAHKLEGLIYAVCDIDEVIRIIRASSTREQAIEGMMEHAFRIEANHPLAPRVPERIAASSRLAGGARLTRVQAEAIGALRLIQLTGLEIEGLANDFTALLAEIDGFEAILADSKRILAIVREEVMDLKQRFNPARKTTIEEGEVNDFDMAALIKEHEVAVSISHQGLVKRLPLATYRAQGRGGVGIKGSQANDGDFTEHLIVCSTHDDLLCFTNTGRLFRTKVFRIPELSRTSKGRSFANLLELKTSETLRGFLPIHEFEQSENFIFFATSQGRVKRSALKEYRNVNRSGIIAVGLNDGDGLIEVLQTSGEDHVLLSTTSGMSIRFDENDARVMGRAAAGVAGIDLREGDTVVGAVVCSDDADLLTLTENGYGKRTSMREYLVQSEDGTVRVQSRGGKGRRDIQTSERNGPVVMVRRVVDTDNILFMSEGGMAVRIRAGDISRIGRATQGVRVVRLKEGDRLVAGALAPEDDASNGTEEVAPVMTDGVS